MSAFVPENEPEVVATALTEEQKAEAANKDLHYEDQDGNPADILLMGFPSLPTTEPAAPIKGDIEKFEVSEKPLAATAFIDELVDKHH